jgi:Rad3-related DNA helicase
LGVLVFIPSYALLRKCVKKWSPDASRRGWGADNYVYKNGGTIWEGFENSKGKVIVEPMGSQAKFEEARDEYADTIRETGNCILLAVFRRKMSEGISFNDANARAVICVGFHSP